VHFITELLVPDLSWHSCKEILIHAFQFLRTVGHYFNFTFSYPGSHWCASFKNVLKHTAYF